MFMKRKSLTIALIVCFLMLETMAFGQANAWENITHIFKENPEYQKGQVSWSIVDLKTGIEVESFQSEKRLIPASTLKLFTGAMILDRLGKSTVLETKVSLTGEIRRSKLKGDLIIKGAGDPSLGSGLAGSINADSVLSQITNALLRKEIESIHGDLIIDPHVLPYDHTVIPRKFIWEDIGSYYGAGTWGLNWRNNEYTVRFSVKSETEPAAVIDSISSWAKQLKINPQVKVVKGNPKEIYFYGGPFEREILAKGELIAGSSITERGSLPNPPLIFAEELKQYLLEKGIEIHGEIRFENTAEWKTDSLTSIKSPTIENMVKEIEFQSNNLFAETLSKLTSDYKSEEYPSGKQIGEWLKARWGNQFSDALFVDGSGLSRNNLLSTKNQTQLLYRLSTDSLAFSTFFNVIPQSGKEGTVRNLPKIEGMRVKSGSMANVRAYSGYFMDADNSPQAFAIIINNVNLPSEIIKSQIIEFLTQASKTSFTAIGLKNK